MGTFINLNVEIEDTTAPSVLHAVGVTGYTNRYVASKVDGTVGSTVTLLRDQVSTDHMTAPTSGQTPATLQETLGFRTVRLAPAGNVSSLLQSSVAHDYPASTLVVVAKMDVSGSQAAASGRKVARGGNTAFSYYSTEGGTPVGTGSVNPGASPTGWAIHIGAADLTASLYQVNTSRGSAGPAITTGGYKFNRIASYADAAPMEIAEMIVFPFKLTTAQFDAVRAALAAQYAGLVP